MANVQMIVWDVQHGNAIYVKTPNGKHLVLDLGIGDYSGHNEAFSPLVTLRNVYKVQTIDLVLISHPHLDHIDDILNLKCFSPGVLTRPDHLTRQIVMPWVRDADKEKFEEYFRFNETYTYPVIGTAKDPSNPYNYGGLIFKTFDTPQLPTNNLNNHSIIAVLEYAGIKIIIPGDNEVASLNLLMQRDDFKAAITNCDILIAPHHGRESAYHPEFVQLANPRLTIISDGSICDTSANQKYSNMSRGWTVRSRLTGDSQQRKLLTTNHDGEVYINLGTPDLPTSYSNFLDVQIP